MNINIVETVGLLTRCSFDERYRDPIISLGGVQSLAELLLVSPTVFVSNCPMIDCPARMRTNFTIGMQRRCPAAGK